MASDGHRDLVCSHCQRSFVRLEHLQRHVRTHTKEKPYRCHCGRVFSRRDLLTRHQRLVHLPTEKPESGADLTGQGQPSRSEEVEDALPESAGGSTVLASPTPQNSYGGFAVPHGPLPGSEADMPQPNQCSSTHGLSNIGSGDIASGTQLNSMDLSGLTNAGDDLSFDDALYTPIQDFTAFVNLMGLSPDWDAVPFSGIGPELQGQTSLLGLTEGNASENINNGSRFVEKQTIAPEASLIGEIQSNAQRRNQQVSVQQSIDRFQSDGDVPNAFDQMAMTVPPWNMSEVQHRQVQDALRDFQYVLPGFVLPSRHTMTRYLSGYFHGFHDHLPFIHVSTFHLDECVPELILALAAVGAQYRFEKRNGLILFDAAKAVALEQRRRRMRKFAEIRSDRSGSTAPHPPKRDSDGQPRFRDLDYSPRARWERMQTVRAVLLVMTFATWEDHPEMLREAIELQSVLSRCLRELGLSDDADASTDASSEWADWARCEADRRTKLIVFSMLTLHTITYNLPPVMLASDVHLRLPCSSRRWNARTAAEWRAASPPDAAPEALFQDALSSLLQHDSAAPPPAHFATPLGNFVLILALIQRSFCIHQLAAHAGPETAGLKDQLERALARWKSSWQRSPTSTLDPVASPATGAASHGPLPFTSTTFLALAYTRLVLDAGPHRALHTRDPLRISAALLALPPVERVREKLIPALLHSVHALGMPVRLGIDFVAKSQHFFWGMMHSVCSLECAVFLARWLYQVGAEGMEGEEGKPICEYEKRILPWVRSIVREAQASSTDLFATTAAAGEEGELDVYDLALAIVRIWAHIFQGNTSWAMVNIIGDSLELLAAEMEKGGVWGRRARDA